MGADEGFESLCVFRVIVGQMKELRRCRIRSLRSLAVLVMSEGELLSSDERSSLLVGPSYVIGGEC
jgi:hypothetical protein